MRGKGDILLFRRASRHSTLLYSPGPLRKQSVYTRGGQSYSYDENGNRTNTGYTTGSNNQLTSDVTFNYTYDDEGNRLTRTRISSAQADDYKTEYTWDHHNRLTQIIYKNNSGTITKQPDYTYDVLGRRIKKSVDADGAGSGAAVDTEYIYDGQHILLAFDDAGDLSNRYLHGPVPKYYGTVRLPTGVHVGIMVVLLRPSQGMIPGNRWGLPVLVHGVSTHAQVLRLRSVQ